MKKKNLIFDFDDTLINSLPLLIEFINTTWNIESIESDYVEQNVLHKIVQKYTNDPSITYEQVYSCYRNDFSLSSEWYDKITPMPYMCEIVNSLAIKYNLYIATKRSNLSSILVDKVLDKYIPNCIENVYYAIKYVEGFGYLYQSKRDFILGLNGESIAFIDDSPLEIKTTEDIIPSFLFDPKNKHKSREMLKMKSWYEIGNHFL